jgi:hypothetical protein
VFDLSLIRGSALCQAVTTDSADPVQGFTKAWLKAILRSHPPLGGWFSDPHFSGNPSLTVTFGWGICLILDRHSVKSGFEGDIRHRSEAGFYAAS